MNIHFTTDIIIGGRSVAHNVIFENEAYRFQPVDGTGESFLLKREDDEWHMQGQINDIAKSQAVAALEKFLLAQH